MAKSSIAAAANVKRKARRNTIDHGRGDVPRSKARNDSIGFEDISDSADRLDHLLLKWVVNFCAQPSHHHVDDVGAGVEVNIPNLLHNFCPGNNIARGIGEEKQKRKLLWRQVECVTRSGDLVPALIDL